jgi:peptide/nickel transport system substrate-binding protein
MKRFLLVAVILVLSIFLILSGCSSTSPTQTTTPTTTSASTPISTPTQTSSTPVSTSSTPTTSVPSSTTPSNLKGGVLKLGYAADSATVSPFSMTRSDDFMRMVPVIERIIIFDKAGLPAPWLAEKWDVDTNAKTITLYLKKGVKFHDGTEFNATVCKWNLDTFKATKRSELAAVDSVNIVDDYTIKLNLNKYDSLILNNLASYPGMMISQTAYEKNGKDWSEKNAVGSGPFKFVKWEKDVGMRLEKFDGYWQSGKPYLDAIEYKIIADTTTMMASFLSGEFDIFTLLQPKDAFDVQKMGKYKISTSGGAINLMAGDGVNANSIFSNVKVRQALEYAIDKEQIARTLGYGFWKPVYQFARPGSWAENPNIVANKYDPVKAKLLLGQAGITEGFKTTVYSTTSQVTKDVMTVVQASLKTIGLDANIEVVERGRENQIATQTGWQDGIFPWGMGGDELQALYRMFSSNATLFRSKFVTKEFQDTLEAAIAATDFNTKQQLTWKLQQMLVDNAMATTLASFTSVAAKTMKVHDDGFADGARYEQGWTPADAWLSK